MSTNLTARDISNLITAVNMVAAGDWDHNSYGKRPDWKSLDDKLKTIRNRHHFALTTGDVKLLNIGLRAGIGDDSIDNIGLTASEQHRLAKIANQLTSATGSGTPYYEE